MSDLNLQIATLTADIIAIKGQMELLLKLVNTAVSTKTLSNLSAVISSDIADIQTAFTDLATTVSSLEQRVIALEQATE